MRLGREDVGTNSQMTAKHLSGWVFGIRRGARRKLLERDDIDPNYLDAGGETQLWWVGGQLSVETRQWSKYCLQGTTSTPTSRNITAEPTELCC